MNKVVMVCFVSLILAACSSPTTTQSNLSAPTNQANQTNQVGQTSTAVAKKAEGIWIDVRTPEEFAGGHIKEAYNITTEQLPDQIATLVPNKDAPINLYCRSGRRAENARVLLMELGYTNVVNHGGYQALLDQGIR